MVDSSQHSSTQIKDNIRDHSPIFIGGAGRSGTSLVRSILNAHSRIAIGAELKVTPLIARFRNQFTHYQAHLQEHFFVQPENIDTIIKNLITSLLDKYRRHADKPRLGEKTPNNVFFFPPLHQMFPESPLLHVVRDGRDVVRSLLQKEWGNVSSRKPMAITQDPEAAASYWKKAVTAGRRAAQASDSLREQYLEIRYEDLVTNPVPIARLIFSHIHEPWEPDVLNFYQEQTDVYNQVYRPISDASVGKWKTGLSPAQKSTVKRVAGDLLIELGYADDMSW